MRSFEKKGLAQAAGISSMRRTASMSRPSTLKRMRPLQAAQRIGAGREVVAAVAQLHAAEDVLLRGIKLDFLEFLGSQHRFIYENLGKVQAGVALYELHTLPGRDLEEPVAFEEILERVGARRAGGRGRRRACRSRKRGTSGRMPRRSAIPVFCCRAMSWRISSSVKSARRP